MKSFNLRPSSLKIQCFSSSFSVLSPASLPPFGSLTQILKFANSLMILQVCNPESILLSL